MWRYLFSSSQDILDLLQIALEIVLDAWPGAPHLWDSPLCSCDPIKTGIPWKTCRVPTHQAHWPAFTHNMKNPVPKETCVDHDHSTSADATDEHPRSWGSLPAVTPAWHKARILLQTRNKWRAKYPLKKLRKASSQPSPLPQHEGLSSAPSDAFWQQPGIAWPSRLGFESHCATWWASKSTLASFFLTSFLFSSWT